MSPAKTVAVDPVVDVTRFCRYAVECDSKRIAGIGLYQAKLATTIPIRNHRYKVRLYHFVFVLGYFILGYQVLATIGEPYRRFLQKADREGFQVMEGTTKLRAEMEHSFRDINDPNRRTKKIGWSDWMDMDIEELAQEKKRDKERNVLDSLPKHMRVPNKYAPAFWPSLAMGIVCTLHALLILLQVWSVSFCVQMNFVEVNPHTVVLPENIMEDTEDDDHKAARTESGGKEEGKPSSFPSQPKLDPIPPHLPTHARIIPANGTRHVLLPLEYIPMLGMTLEFHRRVYVFQMGDDGEVNCDPLFCKVRCRTDLPASFMNTWRGHTAETCRQAQIRYGPNVFSVRQPTFGDLYKAQLLNPLTVFQIFCVLLWAIDDYLVYSFFSLFMVLMFEGTVVFQRLKSLQALRSMGNPSRPICVYRNNQWIWTETTHLVPGDLCSLNRVKPHYKKEEEDGKTNGGATGAAKKKAARREIEDEGGDIVPADLLLLRGSTVVNEASLTGESVPQMKEGLAHPEDTLAMKTKHKQNVVYAGTKMLQCIGALDADEAESDATPSTTSTQNILPPPDGGCLSLVLRTGFASAQGKLVRMIEGSQEKVKGHERETGLLLGLLCLFAIASSSYVLYHGAQDERRSKYELLLHCILIVTSVIRPELPMQMALAVNNSLMTLMKLHVFCTEPYRVPVAGKLDNCLFDKTGTLTTDELVAVGVVLPNKLTESSKSKESKEAQTLLTPMGDIHKSMAALVLAGCHSLVLIEDDTTGDPLELAAMTSMGWQMSEKYARPSPSGKTIVTSTGSAVSQVQILLRHHFSSKLQRMTCVISSGSKRHVVAKGSPEAIGLLLEEKPRGYDAMSQQLAKEGYRLIALAYKDLTTAEGDLAVRSWTRSECEGHFIFAGFIAFTCMVRKDTRLVLAKLKEGGMNVAMVTGDALLTAIHVAKEVAICEPIGDAPRADELAETNLEVRALLQKKRGRENSAHQDGKVYKPICHLEEDEKKRLYWCSYEDGSKVQDYVAGEVPAMSRKYDLATTGKSLAAALEFDEETRVILGYIKVFARMTPDAKETVIECLHSVDSLCLMCGDGANDVGALKQADVGVALLSGFGNVNVDKGDKKQEDKKEDDGVRAIMSREHLDQIRQLPVAVIKMKIRQLGVDPNKYPELVEKDDLVQLYQLKAREVAIKKHDEQNKKARANMTKQELAEERKREMAEKQKRMVERAAELEAQGVQWATFKAMQEFYAEETAAAKKKKEGMMRAGGIEGSAASIAAQFEEMESAELPMVKLGDASIAAPFTSKMPSIRSCVDIVRQGRCTLVSSIQMYQIMALQCLISSYSLSVLYLDGVKYGDSQMTAMGLLGSVSFMSVSRSKPLEKLSKVRPLTSIFHPAMFASLLLQFAVHLTTMLLAVFSAKKHLPPDYDPELDGVFKPGMLNTCVFLVSSVQQVTVFAVNLQGPPFMTGVTDNTPLLWSLIGTFMLTFMFASETIPGLNRYFQLVPFPDEDYRDFVLTILVADLILCYLLDRLMKFIFAPQILFASFEGTTWNDMYKLVRSFMFVGMLMYFFMGNSEQWDELLAMEQNLTANLTEGSDEVVEAIKECVGDACEVIAEVINETIDSIREEF